MMKKHECISCEYYVPDAIDTCTYVCKLNEDGSLDFTLPCEQNKSIDKQPTK